jgi:uncharacterized protein YndB with AHSA1/START domain
MMDTQKLEAGASLKIGKPVEDVFEAIVDPEKMSRYFISKSTGRMESGKTLTWKFPEFDMTFPVEIIRAEKGRPISFQWGSMDGSNTVVEISLEPRGDKETLVSVKEGTKENNEAGLKWMRGNTEGWANFLACLKAYLEYGINLRKGAFDASRLEESSKQ